MKFQCSFCDIYIFIYLLLGCIAAALEADQGSIKSILLPKS